MPTAYIKLGFTLKPTTTSMMMVLLIEEATPSTGYVGKQAENLLKGGDHHEPHGLRADCQPYRRAEPAGIQQLDYLTQGQAQYSTGSSSQGTTAQ